MKRLAAGVGVACVSALGADAGLALAQGAREAQPLAANAALVYVAAEKPLGGPGPGPANREPMERAIAAEFEITEALRAALADPTYQDVLRATELEECDFGVDLSKGPEGLLPHISPINWCAGLILLDARRSTEAGEHNVAAERLAAALRLAEHLSRDRIVVSCLVSNRVLENAMVLFERIDWSAAGDEGKVRVREAIARFDAADPLRMREAVANDCKGTAAWATVCLSTSAGRKRMQELIDSIATLDDPNPIDAAEVMPQIKRFGYRWSVEGFRRSYDDALSVWDAEDAPERLRAIGEEVSEGAYGPLAELLTIAWVVPWTRAQEAKERLREMGAAVGQ